MRQDEEERDVNHHGIPHKVGPDVDRTLGDKAIHVEEVKDTIPCQEAQMSKKNETRPYIKNENVQESQT